MGLPVLRRSFAAGCFLSWLPAQAQLRPSQSSSRSWRQRERGLALFVPQLRKLAFAKCLRRNLALPVVSPAFPPSGDASSTTPSVLGCSFEIADTAPLFGASALSTVDTGGDTSLSAAPSFSGSLFSVSFAPAVSDVVAAPPHGGPGAGAASLFCGTASCGVLCSPVDSGCVGGTGFEPSVTLCSGEALPIGGSCGAFVSTGGGADCEGAAGDWLCWVGGVDVGVLASSWLVFLPRLKMPLKTRLTMLAASGAVGRGWKSASSSNSREQVATYERRAS